MFAGLLPLPCMLLFLGAHLKGQRMRLTPSYLQMMYESVSAAYELASLVTILMVMMSEKGDDHDTFLLLGQTCEKNDEW